MDMRFGTWNVRSMYRAGSLKAIEEEISKYKLDLVGILLNVHRVSDVRQIEIHTGEPLVLDPNPFEVEIAIAKLKRFKSPHSDQIPVEHIQAGGEILHSKIHKN
jgi:hypothetical protein